MANVTHLTAVKFTAEIFAVYLTLFRGGMGIKTSGTVQVLCMHWSFALKLDYVLIKYEKPQKNMHFLACFKHFCRFFNFRESLAQNATKFIFFEFVAFFDTSFTPEYG